MDFHVKMSFKSFSAGELAGQLNVRTALIEDPSSVPGTHLGGSQLQLLGIQGLRPLRASSLKSTDLYTETCVKLKITEMCFS